MKTQPLTACKRHSPAPAHAGHHKATSPTRKPLAFMTEEKGLLGLKIG